MIKYPRTPHLEGSRLQPGDEDLEQVPFEAIASRFVVIEEKVDGANAGIWFDQEGELRLQSRGHVLTGGARERQFALFKTWARTFQSELFEVPGGRYTLYGEWMFAKHTVFYDALPHYFLEYDLLDRETGRFLSTRRRRELLAGAAVVPVPVLYAGLTPVAEELRRLAGPSRFKTPSWREVLREVARKEHLDAEGVLAETDPANEMEGIYIKVETEDETVGRVKFVRPSFVTAILDSNSHWHNRPIVPNQLAPGVDIFRGVS